MKLAGIFSFRLIESEQDIKDLVGCGQEFDHALTEDDIRQTPIFMAFYLGKLVAWFQCYRNALWFPAFNPHRITPIQTIHLLREVAIYLKCKAATENDRIGQFIVIPSQGKFTPEILYGVGFEPHEEGSNLWRPRKDG